MVGLGFEVRLSTYTTVPRCHDERKSSCSGLGFPAPVGEYDTHRDCTLKCAPSPSGKLTFQVARTRSLSVFTITRGSRSYPILQMRKLRPEKFECQQQKIMGRERSGEDPAAAITGTSPHSLGPGPASRGLPAVVGDTDWLSSKPEGGRRCYSQKAQPKSQMLSMCLEHFPLLIIISYNYPAGSDGSSTKRQGNRCLGYLSYRARSL